jgi:hypothetical protein
MRRKEAPGSAEQKPWSNWGHLWQFRNPLESSRTESAKIYSALSEWLSRSGCAQLQHSETPLWQITHPPASFQHFAWYIAPRSLFHRYFAFCSSPIINELSTGLANSDHTSEWVHWGRACIGIPMQSVMLQKSLLTLLLPANNMQFSLY